MTHTILIADDDPDNREIAREILQSAGHTVILATNGNEAIRCAREQHPALILMDLSMPRMDGWQAATILKNDEATKGIIIIAFTAHASHDDHTKALSSQCDDYISKPCHPRLLLEKINFWLEKISPR